MFSISLKPAPCVFIFLMDPGQIVFINLQSNTSYNLYYLILTTYFMDPGQIVLINLQNNTSSFNTALL